MTSYAYAPGGVLEAISSASVVASLIERDHGFPAQITGTTVRNRATGQEGPVQDYDTYPQQIVRTGNVDKWTTLQTTTQAGVQPDGAWLTTETYGDMPYADAKRIARDDLATYIQAYRQSYFTAGGFTFPANTDRLMVYNTVNTFATRLDRQNREAPTPLDTSDVPLEGVWIFDVDDKPFQVTTIGVWDTFVNKWDNLWEAATAISLQAWTDVGNATTTDEVRQIINALPPIPTAESP